jgi:hypothetical protein
MATPKWLDDVPNVDFTQEKRLLNEFVQWGAELGWNPVDSIGMDFNARAQTDLALGKDDRRLRVAVLQKSRSAQGSVRIQSVPEFREANLVWDSRQKQWHIELGGVPLDRAWDKAAFEWLVARLFAA